MTPEGDEPPLFWVGLLGRNPVTGDVDCQFAVKGY